MIIIDAHSHTRARFDMTTATLRFNNQFSGVYSKLIAVGQGMKNNGVFASAITPNLEIEAQTLLRKEPTENLFAAAAKPELAVMSVKFSDALSLQDVIINTAAAILANDTAAFLKISDEWNVKENRRDSYSAYTPTKAFRAKYGDGDDISDEMRDELSGANVDASMADNDCGDSCKV